MTVRGGRELLASPGPTNIPDEVLQAMHRPAVEIYAKPLIAMTDSLLRDLSRMFRTAGRSYIYIANGHGAWEAALTNVLSKGDKILLLESGKFALDWGDAAARLGIEVEVVPGDWRHAIHPEEIERRLSADKRNTIKAILAVHIDTSSSLLSDVAGIGQAIKSAQHDALLVVDAVASLGCVPFEMDASQSRFAHALLGLDGARWRSALRQICGHAADADDVCDAPGARHAVCRRDR